MSGAATSGWKARAFGALLLLPLVPAAAAAQEAGGPGRGRTSLPGGEIAGANAAKLGIPRAIELAEKAGNGRAVGAVFTAFPRGGGSHEIDVLKADGALSHYNIDANTGSVVGVTDKPVQSYVTSLTAEAIAKSTTTLTRAIAIAEGAAPGARAIGAQTEQDGEVVSFEVTIAAGDGGRTVHVDSSGKAE